jgi:hypothetical protein
MGVHYVNTLFRQYIFGILTQVALNATVESATGAAKAGTRITGYPGLGRF